MKMLQAGPWNFRKPENQAGSPNPRGGHGPQLKRGLFSYYLLSTFYQIYVNPYYFS